MIDKNKKILITGASGFIGSNLLKKLLELGFTNISIITRNKSNLSRINHLLNKINIIQCDLNNLLELEKNISKVKPKIIYHIAAAGTSGGKDKITFEQLFNSNFILTKNLLNICMKYGFEYFINTGSSSEYGEKEKPMNENDFLEPNNDYGLVKGFATNYCKYIGEKEKLPIYTFRIFSAYGNGEEERRLIPTLINSYKNKIAPKLSSKNSVRDYIFIDDIIKYYLNIDKLKGNFGGIYNLGNGVQYSIAEVIKIIQKIYNSDIEPNYGNIKSTQNEPKFWLSNIEKINKTFGIKNTTIEEGLKKLLNK